LRLAATQFGTPWLFLLLLPGGTPWSFNPLLLLSCTMLLFVAALQAAGQRIPVPQGKGGRAAEGRLAAGGGRKTREQQQPTRF
jgi:hypothetical protein